METETENLISVQKAADRLGVHENTVYRWIHKRGLPARRAGKVWRIYWSDVETWMESEGAPDGR